MLKVGAKRLPVASYVAHSGMQQSIIDMNKLYQLPAKLTSSSLGMLPY